MVSLEEKKVGGKNEKPRVVERRLYAYNIGHCLQRGNFGLSEGNTKRNARDW